MAGRHGMSTSVSAHIVPASQMFSRVHGGEDRVVVHANATGTVGTQDLALFVDRAELIRLRDVAAGALIELDRQQDEWADEIAAALPDSAPAA